MMKYTTPLGLIVIGLLLTVSAMAEVVSEHNEAHVAQDKMQDLLKEEGCRGTKTVRTQRFQVERVDGSSFKATQILTTTCVEWEGEKPNVRISWNPPTTRLDGSPLPREEVQEYLIRGLFPETVRVTSSPVEFRVPPGTYHVQMATVDTTGLVSAFSDVIPLVVE